MVERTPILDAVCHAILILGAAMVCLPLYFAFVASSLSIQELLAAPMPWLPGSEFLENIAAAWSRGNLGRVLLNSLVIAIGITAGKLAVSLIAAFSVTYFRFPFRMTAFWLIFVSLMLPIEVRIVPTYESVANVLLPLNLVIEALNRTGLWPALTGGTIDFRFDWTLINTYPGLIFPLIASATATFLFRQFFLTVPDELCEAARMDGASPMTFFRAILLPLSRSNIIALSIILFLYGWNQYLWPLLATTDPDMATAVMRIKQLIPDSSQPPAWNITMAASLLAMLPPAIVILLMQRMFLKGLVDTGK